MAMTVIVAAIICVIALIFAGTRWAFLYVYLPIALFTPTYFFWTMRPLPSLSFAQMALIPIFVGMLFLDLPQWRFSTKDVWMVIFIFTSFYGEYSMGNTSEAILTLFLTLTVGLIPYMAGKLLVEVPGGRAAFARQYVWLLVAVFIPSVYEYFAKQNVICHTFNHLFPSQYCTVTQLRWGFGRVAGPYSASEVAGMMASIALVFACWLGSRMNQHQESPTARFSFFRLRYPVILILIAFLWVTQARGPWIGTALALSIAYIGRAAKPMRRAVIVFGLLIAVAIPVYVWGKDYASGPRKDFGSERETAQYRTELVQNYIPLAQAGGLWGWGFHFQRIDGQVSIDNEYLLAYLIQGSVGVGMFLLLIGQTVVVLMIKGFKAKTQSDRYFVFTLLGIVVGFAFTIATVATRPWVTYQLFFLLMGWSDSIQLADGDVVEERAAENRKVIEAGSYVRVYS